jgi:hypothetical protein
VAILILLEIILKESSKAKEDFIFIFAVNGLKLLGIILHVNFYYYSQKKHRKIVY